MHLYIHIPFCKQACYYCDFHFSTNLKLKEAMVEAICKEISFQKHFLGGNELSSIYFGGGTPSLLSESDLAIIFDTIHKYFNVTQNAEITLEANPDDINNDNLVIWKKTGVNRLSIGIQSFDEEQLKFMHRAHNAHEAEECVSLARDQGFEQLTIDLIYAIPSQSHDIWKQNLEKAVKLDLPHISSYCLTIEEKTVFGSRTKKGLMAPIQDDFASQQYQLLVDTFEEHQLEQYEISNFARNEAFAQHNTSYWQGEAYLGIGPSAHSFDGKNVRQWNISNNSRYLKSIDQGSLAFEKEILTPKERVNELIMTGLRTKWGVNLDKVLALVPTFSEQNKEELDRLFDQGLLKHENNHLVLSKEGRIQADGIASGLFLV